MNQNLSQFDISTAWPEGHVGYCAILGRPNAGKSTFLNHLLGYHLAAVSDKPQTTRRRWLGIFIDHESQILFLDTPGVHKPVHALGKHMAASINRVIEETDTLLCLADAKRGPGREEEMVAHHAAQTDKTTFVAVNKSDVASDEEIERTMSFWQARLPQAPQYVISASQGYNCPELVGGIKNALSWGPFLFEPDTITDAMERQIAAEYIREATYTHLHHEIPHATAVTIEHWEENNSARHIYANLHVERAQQRHILLGAKGRMIRNIREYAEDGLSNLWETPVKVHLWVKVSHNWRKKPKRAAELA